MKKLLLVLFLLCVSAAQARDIKLIVPFSPGGSSDRVTRELAPLLSTPEYNFVIDYKIGAGGSVAANFVAQTKKETVLMIITNGLVGNPIITQTNTYDLNRDFVFVGFVGIEPLIVAVSNQLKITNFKEFLELSRRMDLPYGSAGVGTSGHLSAAIISNNNPRLFHVPYKGGSAVVTDLISGNVKWVVESYIALGAFIADQKITPLAIYARQRSPQYPNVPTVRELGVNDYQFYRWHIAVANAQADADVVKHVSDRLQDPQVQRKIKELGLDPTHPAHIKNFFSVENERMQKLITDFRILQ